MPIWGVPLMSDKVLIDTSAFYALVSGSDEFHFKAKTTYERLIDQKMELYTSSYIFVESAALIQHRLGLATLEKFVESIKESIYILWVDERPHWQAWEILKNRLRERLSFVDCTTIVLTKALNAKVFAFDEDFSREGLSLLP
jgi:predicted nucleic acid-binding protein